MRFRTLTIAALAGTSVIFSAAASEQLNTPEFKSQLPPGQIASKITPDSDVGMVVLIKYDGTIETYATDGGDLNFEPAGTELPDGNLGDGKNGKIEFVVDQTNPRCIWCKHNGQVVKICR